MRTGLDLLDSGESFSPRFTYDNLTGTQDGHAHLQEEGDHSKRYWKKGTLCFEKLTSPSVHWTERMMSSLIISNNSAASIWSSATVSQPIIQIVQQRMVREGWLQLTKLTKLRFIVHLSPISWYLLLHLPRPSTNSRNTKPSWCRWGRR